MNRYFNIYFDSGEFWIELEQHNFVDIYDRHVETKQVYDPMFTIPGKEIYYLLEMSEEEIPEDEIEDYNLIFKEKIEELVKEEIPFELFLKWLE